MLWLHSYEMPWLPYVGMIAFDGVVTAASYCDVTDVLWMFKRTYARAANETVKGMFCWYGGP